MMYLQQVGGSTGIDTATFLVVVSALASAIAALAGLLYKRLMAENAELKARLDAYSESAPEFISTVEAWMSEHDHSSQASASDQSPTPSTPTRPTTTRIRRRPRKGITT